MEIKKKTTQMPQEFGVCIDWETSGAIFGGDSSKDHQGISFGAVIFRTKTFEPVAKLYKLIKFDEQKYKWTESAQKIHGLTKERLAAEGVTQEEAAMELLELILKYFGPSSKVMILGHNPEFDNKFTNQLLATIDFELTREILTLKERNAALHPDRVYIEMHHVVLDTSALGFITLGLSKSDLLFERIGFADRGEHNALIDAEMTLQTCAAMKQLVEAALG